jgi:DNA-binding MarR family transcriptional regulator
MSVSQKLKFVFQLAKANAALSRRFSSQGLGFSDVAVLVAISQAPGEKIRRVDLASQLGLSASGVTRLLIPLEKIGIVKRETNARDARVSYATLTAAGKRVLGDSLLSAEELCEDLMPQEKPKKLEEASDILETLAKA